MKKIFIAILSLGSMAVGAIIDLGNPTFQGIAILTLDVNAIQEIMGSGFGGFGDAKDLVLFTGTWENTGVSAYLGVANNGSSTTHITTLYNSWLHGTSTNRSQVFTGFPEQLITPSSDWDDIKAMSLVFSYDSSSAITGTNQYVAVSILNSKGEVTTYAGERINAMVFNASPVKLKASGIEYADDYVTSFEWKAAASSLAQVKAYSQAAVPEPATGTLALLALAGLCARRRRR